jgi:hypothetical protein
MVERKDDHLGSASHFDRGFDDSAADDDDDVFQHQPDIDDNTAALFEMLWCERLSSQSHVINFGVAEVVALVQHSKLHYTTRIGVSFLHIAAAGDNTAFVQHLIDNVGLAVDCKDSLGRTPLHEAVAYGAGEAVQVLLNRGANLYAVGNTGESVLHTAARHDQAYMIIKLLQHSVGQTGPWHSDDGFIACKTETNRIQRQQNMLLAQTSLHSKGSRRISIAPSRLRKRMGRFSKSSIATMAGDRRTTMDSNVLLHVQDTARRYPCPCHSSLIFESCHGEELEL